MSKINLAPRFSPELERILAPVFADKAVGVRLRNYLAFDKIYSLDDMLTKSKADLMRIPNLGKRSIGLVIECLEQHGFHLCNDGVYTIPQSKEDKNLKTTLRLFREFVNANAIKWRIGANQHHPIWARVAEALGDENDRKMTEKEYKFAVYGHGDDV